jgi:hypothetical protein
MTVDPILAGAPAVALTGLAGGYGPRPITPLMPWRSEHRVVKPYVITATEAGWDDAMVAAVRPVAARQLAFDEALDGVGLAVVVLHVGEGGSSLLVQSWARDYKSRISSFTGLDVSDLRPAPIGAGPSVWELEVLGYERGAYVRNILSGEVDTEAWLNDVLDTRPA